MLMIWWKYITIFCDLLSSVRVQRGLPAMQEDVIAKELKEVCQVDTNVN
jgi:hypothetical protein